MKWGRAESIPVLEGRAAFWGLRHHCRKLANHNKKVLLLTDSMSAILAFGKGRSSAIGLGSICRRWSAFSLACNISPKVRWIASERNPADGPSRNAGLFGKRVLEQRGGATSSRGFDALASKLEPPAEVIAKTRDQRAEATRGSCAVNSKVRDVQARQGGEEKGGAEETQEGDEPSSGPGGAPVYLKRVRGRLQTLRELACADENDGVELGVHGLRAHEVFRPGVPGRASQLDGFTLAECGVPFSAGVERTAGRKVQASHAGAEGLVPGHSTEIKIANAVGSDMLLGHRSNSKRSTRDGFRLFADGRVLSETWRNADAADAAIDTASTYTAAWSDTTPTLGACFVPAGRRGDEQDGRVRPKQGAVPSRAPVLGGDSCTGEEGESGRSIRLRLRVSRVGAGVQEDGDPASSSCSWASSPLRATPRRSLGGCRQREAEPGTGPKERLLEQPVVGETLREGRESHRAASQVGQEGAGKVLARRRGDRGSCEGSSGPKRVNELALARDPIRALNVLRRSPLPVRVGLELFSGSGNFSKAWRDKLGLPIMECVFLHNDMHDLTKVKLQKLVRGWILSGIVVGVWLGTPCGSFSRARERPGGGLLHCAAMNSHSVYLTSGSAIKRKSRLAMSWRPSVLLFFKFADVCLFPLPWRILTFPVYGHIQRP